MENLMSVEFISHNVSFVNHKVLVISAKYMNLGSLSTTAPELKGLFYYQKFLAGSYKAQMQNIH